MVRLYTDVANAVAAELTSEEFGPIEFCWRPRVTGPPLLLPSRTLTNISRSIYLWTEGTFSFS